ESDRKWFGGVTCTNGAGSARTGLFGDHTDEQMMVVRRQEQNRAAATGRYGVMIQLDYPSRIVRDPTDVRVREDLFEILTATQPEIVYTHNPADKHETHIGVFVAAIQAMRLLPRGRRLSRVIGCEVWRDLDWLPDQDKVLMDVSGNDELAL